MLKFVTCKTFNALKDIVDSYSEVPEYEYHNIFAEDSGTSGDGLMVSYGNGDAGDIGFRVMNGSELIGIGFNADNVADNSSLDIEVVDISDLANISVIHTHSVVGVGDGQANNAHTYEDLRAAPVTIPDGAVVALRIANEQGGYNGYRVNYEYRTPTGRTLLTTNS